MSNDEIEEAVQQCKRDMFTMRIKFAKREVRTHRRLRRGWDACCGPAMCPTPGAMW